MYRFIDVPCFCQWLSNSGHLFHHEELENSIAVFTSCLDHHQHRTVIFKIITQMRGMLQITGFLQGSNTLGYCSEVTQAQQSGLTRLKGDDIVWRLARQSWNWQRWLQRRVLQGIKSPRLYVVCPFVTKKQYSCRVSGETQGGQVSSQLPRVILRSQRHLCINETREWLCWTRLSHSKGIAPTEASKSKPQTFRNKEIEHLQWNREGSVVEVTGCEIRKMKELTFKETRIIKSTLLH